MSFCAVLECANYAPCPRHLECKEVKQEPDESEEKIKLFVAWQERGVEPRMETIEVNPAAGLLALRATVAFNMRVQPSAISLYLGNPPKMCLDQFLEAEDVRIDCLLQPFTCITAKLAATSIGVPQSHSEAVKENNLDWASMLKDSVDKFPTKKLFDRAFVVQGMLSPDECEALTAASESLGYDPVEYNPKYRSNTRVVIHSQPLAERFYQRILACELVPRCVTDPKTSRRWHISGLNPSWRFCRYLPPQHFSAHCDGAFQASEQEVTWFTVNLYLNGGFEGGNTRFFVYPPEMKSVLKKPKPQAKPKPKKEREGLRDFLQKQKQNSATAQTTSSPSLTPSHVSPSNSALPTDETTVEEIEEEYEEVEVFLTNADLIARGPSHAVTPETGLALIFDHWSRSYLHDGAPLEKGVKYILRTDILYKLQPLEQQCNCTRDAS